MVRTDECARKKTASGRLGKKNVAAAGGARRKRKADDGLRQRREIELALGALMEDDVEPVQFVVAAVRDERGRASRGN